MADNTQLNLGSSGDIVATDDIGGIKHQRVKLEVGADGTANDVIGADAAGDTDGSAVVPVAITGQYDDAATGTVTENQFAPIRITSSREMMVTGSVTSVVAGTGATNLGKAEDAGHTSGDTGVMALGVQRANPLDGKRSGSDSDYEVLHVNNQRLLVSPNIVQLIDNFSDHTSWAAVNDDTTSVADEATNYIAGGSSTSFAKANGTANTTYALISKSITAVNFLNGITGSAFLQFVVYIPDTTNVTNAVIRLGTDSSNYGEWLADTTDAVNGWNMFRVALTQLTSATGTGWSGSAVTYVAVGLQFGAESDTLAGIVADALIFNGGNVVEANLTATNNIDAANVNIQKIGNIVVARGSGSVSTGTQRITIATDDVNLAAINSTLGAIVADDADFTATTTPGLPVQGVYESSPSAVTDGDLGIVGITSTRAMRTSDANWQTYDNAAADGLSVSGDVAHDSADAGEPVKIGGKAYAASATAVSANDRVNAVFDLEGRQIVRTGNQDLTAFAVHHTPAANTQATISQSAGAGSLRNVCTSITATWSSDAAPSAAQVKVYLRDGATGAGTIKWSATLSLPATAGANTGVTIAPLWIVGTAATAMTLEFSAAGGANTYEDVSMTGVVIT